MLTDIAETMVTVNQKSQRKRLAEIQGNPITKLNVSSLRLFYQQVGLKGQRKKLEFHLCLAVVEAKDSGAWKEWAKVAESTQLVKPEKVKANVITNRHMF